MSCFALVRVRLRLRLRVRVRARARARGRGRGRGMGRVRDRDRVRVRVRVSSPHRDLVGHQAVRQGGVGRGLAALVGAQARGRARGLAGAQRGERGGPLVLARVREVARVVLEEVVLVRVRVRGRGRGRGRVRVGRP